MPRAGHRGATGRQPIAALKNGIGAGVEGVLAGFGIEGHAPVFERQRAIGQNHRIELAMGTGVNADDGVFVIELEPDVLEFVEMLDVPIPPDRIFDHLGDARLERYGEGRGGRLPGSVKHRHADF